MNVVTPKNKVEQGFVNAFESVADQLTGDGEIRKAAIARFEATGLPHRRIEEWKYTDLRNMLKEAHAPATGLPGEAALTPDALGKALGPLAQLDATRIVFVDGRHVSGLDAGAQDGLSVATLANALNGEANKTSALLANGEITLRGSAVVDLNAAFANDGAHINIAADAKLEKPVLIVHVAQNDAPATSTLRHKLTCESGAEACVVEVFVRADGAADHGLTNTVSEVSVGDGATLHHIKCVAGSAKISHLANWHVTIGGDASYRAFHLTAESGVSRSDGLVQFKGEGSELDFSGIFLGRNSDHIDTTLVVEHLVPQCTSRELFKGVLDDQARGIFQAKVLVAQDAQKTDGKQMAQALMLSPDAEFDSKPELEIYADDVLCGHGSTSAEIDEDLLFYLRSRGIPKDQARALLIESFVGEALECVEVDGVREALSEIANSWLAKI